MAMNLRAELPAVLSCACLCVALVMLPSATRAANQVKGGTGGTPGFAGTWTIDPAKSDPPPAGRGGGAPGGGVTITISQTPNEITISTEGRQGPQTMTYKLDGSESTNQVAGRGGTQTVRSKAKWDGSRLIIDTTREFQGLTIGTHEVRHLENDGKAMVVESTTETPQGQLTRKIVYMKGS